MNGIQLTKNLSQQNLLESSRIILMTTSAINEVEKLVEYPLFNAVVNKPINESVLIDAVELTMNESSLFSAVI